MAARDSFLLRTDPKVLDALRQWRATSYAASTDKSSFCFGERSRTRDACRVSRQTTMRLTIQHNPNAAEYSEGLFQGHAPAS